MGFGLGNSGGISIKTGFEDDRCLSVGIIEIIVGLANVRIFTVGGISSSGSFLTVIIFLSAAFFSINLVMRLIFLSTL